MGIELTSETRIVVGRLVAPTDEARPWWWESSTRVDGVEMIVAGFASTESDAILEAAASTLDLRAPAGGTAAPTQPEEPYGWGLNGSRARQRAPSRARSTSG